MTFSTVHINGQHVTLRNKTNILILKTKQTTFFPGTFGLQLNIKCADELFSKSYIIILPLEELLIPTEILQLVWRVTKKEHTLWVEFCCLA